MNRKTANRIGNLGISLLLFLWIYLVFTRDVSYNYLAFFTSAALAVWLIVSVFFRYWGKLWFWIAVLINLATSIGLGWFYFAVVLANYHPDYGFPHHSARRGWIAVAIPYLAIVTLINLFVLGRIKGVAERRSQTLLQHTSQIHL